MGNICGGGPKPTNDKTLDDKKDKKKLNLESFNFHRKTRFANDYKMGKELGQGAFGKVRACEHRVSGQNFAVKMLSKSAMKSEHIEEF